MQFAWLLHSGMYSFSSRREIINQLKMPQRCILRCSVQPVHLYAKMLSWQKKASNLFSNWRIKFDISKSKSERESFKRIHFWLSFPIYQFYASMLLVSLYGLIRNVQHSGKERRRKEKHNPPPPAPHLSCNLCYWYLVYPIHRNLLLTCSSTCYFLSTTEVSVVLSFFFHIQRE